jgi:hypothetical protein
MLYTGGRVLMCINTRRAKLINLFTVRRFAPD